MKSRLLFFLKYTLYWLSVFILFKILFLIVYFQKSSELNFIEILKIFYYGIKLDISSTAYILTIISLIFAFSFLINNRFLAYVINIYTIIFLLITVLLITVDLQLYNFWGFRLDATPLLYITTPKEAMASVTTSMIIKFFVFLIALISTCYYIYYIFLGKKLKKIEKTDYKILLVFIFIFSTLIIPVRGGVGIAPINIGSAYFHKNQFANHAAINVTWNVFYSISKRKVLNNNYSFFNENKVESLFNELTEDNSTLNKVIKNNRPNIIIIILESFTANVIKPLGGLDSITPNFNKLTEEGILFNNFYASGDRSDKGIVSIISGYPAQPTTSIIKHAQKTQSLPFLSKDLKIYGYSSAFYYGGDIDFANMRSYFVIGGFDEIIDKDNFASSLNNTKWGVHDQYVLDRFFSDINNSNTPFFKVLFTLSSHEPFDVPMETVIKGKSEEEKFLNSIYYTDKCIGNFINKAKHTKWWDNTLIILIADHGSRHPDKIPNYSPKKFSIPMLWLGGVLSVKDTVINRYSSQTDIPNTILSQLSIKNKDYIYSKNIFSDNSNSYSYYVFNDGFGFLTDSLKLVYNNISQKYIIKNGKISQKNENYGKAYLQYVMNDFTHK
ncbi:MAG: sulfatase-like hydrolase/transferase [Bacteroidales bacterium]|nr:sulfatase-like hydrolase/transferase [Bacteroidales bacterium]